MTEERIVETRGPEGTTHTHTTVVTDGRGERRSGAGTVILLIVAAIVVLAAIWAFTNMSGAEVAKDNAIADAAGEVGAAAGEVGEAAQDAAGAITN
jgi:flagellar basal body-associated protein FliL